MLKARRKALKSLLQEKVVNIADFRSLASARAVRRIGVVSGDPTLTEGLQTKLQGVAEVSIFDSRFTLEQALKANEWDAIVLDERTLVDDTLTLCEKIKRQGKGEEIFVMILSEKSGKDLVRQGFEKGCDEWVTKFESVDHLARLLSQSIS